jgi:hypothetical protein
MFYIRWADRCIFKRPRNDAITFDRRGFSSPRQGYSFFTL